YQTFLNQDEWLPLTRRIEILTKVETLMKDQVRELALGAAEEGGKPFMDSLVEANRAVDGIRLCIDTLRTESGHVIPMGAT
ncbi:aldehyde dehydrogenase family protein, partial [Streptococcus suis]|uniref:aldehyde dehydrogenase family protein n=1 Tax=Streptococcus suis TaxID=1307 RepID=UPI003CF032FB